MDTITIFQKGFNYSQDGPGNRLVYHLSGCSASCPWCSNPEGKRRDAGKAVPISEILSECISAKPVFIEGGGITFTGGEATEQFEALKKLLLLLKDAGISTCLETNGSHPNLPSLFPLIDFLIMDCKHYSDAAYQSVIGYSIRPVLENIRAAARREQVLLRIPLIGGFNETCEDAAEFAALFKKLGVSERITLEVLRYHEFGKAKYEKLGEAYKMTDRAKISDEVYLAFTSALKDSGIQLINT